MKNVHTMIVITLLISTALMLPSASSELNKSNSHTILDPSTIPKFENQLTGPLPFYQPTIITQNGMAVKYEYTVSMNAFTEQMLPPSMNLLTPVWGFGANAQDAVTGASLGFIQSSPGLTFETVQGVPAIVKWVNNITTPYMFPVDPTIMWANPNNYPTPTPPYPPYPPGYPQDQSPVPLVIHLHGSETQSYYDGDPNAWFTNSGIHGPDYQTYEQTDPNAAVYYYPNTQPPTMLWYHDHALGVTRLNLYSGLEGLYVINQPDNASDYVAPLLPKGKYDVPLVIQDKKFYNNGSMYFPTVGTNPNMNPYWYSGFLGDTNVVNGKVWPNMNVDAGQYRFRLLDTSDVRLYNLTLYDTQTNTLLPFTQIGTDGGYLRTAVNITSLNLGPAERADILVDFSNLPAGSKIQLRNTAVFNLETQTVGQVMQFTVGGQDGSTPQTLPSMLNPTLAGPFPDLPNPTKTRIFALYSPLTPSGPAMFLLNGQSYDAKISEVINVGATEDWEFIDLSDSNHLLHLHLIQFQIVSRQSINASRYATDWINLQREALGNSSAVPPWPVDFMPKELPIQPYLIGNATQANPNEQGWKDTVETFPFAVTIIRVRFAQQDGSAFTFDPTKGPGYVWHCHMIDHEDNMMMRPFILVNPSQESSKTLYLTISSVVAVAVVIIVVVFLSLRRRALRQKKQPIKQSNRQKVQSKQYAP
jgi:spore coat protein A